MKKTPKALSTVLLLVAAAALEDGNIGCQNSAGALVEGSDAASLKAVGIIGQDADSGETDVKVIQDKFVLENGTSGEAFAPTDPAGSVAYIVDAHTVGKVGGTNKTPCGLFCGLIPEGVVVDMSPAALAAARALAPAAHLADTAAAAGACAGSTTPSATQVDTAIATAIAPLVTSFNALLVKLEAKNILAAS